MNSQWNDSTAAQFANDPLALRVYTSRLLGGDPALVLHGGGNTSVKATTTDLFGDPVDVLYVKGSGWDLATIEATGFAPVRLDVLRRMAGLEQLSDSNMVQGQRAALLDPNAPTPSVEAILHAIIPFRFVDHTHSDAIVTLTNTPDGADRSREVLGPNVLIVPYVMPGFVLAKTVYEMTRDFSDADWAELDGILLLNHGLFTFSDDARTSYEQHLALVTRAEEHLAAVAGDAVRRAKEEAIDLHQLAHLRKVVSEARGLPIYAILDKRPEIAGFAKRDDASDLGTRGLLTPDHVIRTKRTPLIVPSSVEYGDIEMGDAEASVQAYVDAYCDYFERHAANFSGGDLTMLDPAPRWAIWPGYGAVIFGHTLKEVRISRDVIEHTLAAAQRAEALGGWAVLGEQEIFDIEYWELEQAKLKRGATPAPLQGKIALVTGAASGIGKACVQALVAQGVAVAALDINPDVQQMFKTDGPDQPVLGLTCDLTDEDSVFEAVYATAGRFGGLDLLVSNAGMFPSSQPIAEMDAASWDKSMTLNLTSHQRLLTECAGFLKRGIDPAVVVIASKNVPAPGPGAAAYSVAKAGLTQLARVAALELGGDGVRVNVLHPNAVFDTGIWTDDVLQKRAATYGLSVDEYKRNNVLRTEITSHDVANLAVAMCGPLFAKTTGAQVPVDGGNERVI